MTKPLNAGDHVFVFRANDSFPGEVLDTRRGWVRVTGAGSVIDPSKAVRKIYYDEWLPLDAAKMRVMRQ